MWVVPAILYAFVHDTRNERHRAVSPVVSECLLGVLICGAWLGSQWSSYEQGICGKDAERVEGRRAYRKGMEQDGSQMEPARTAVDHAYKGCGADVGNLWGGVKGT
jgi:hypothetical protein